jgi:hypothetical protein
MWAGAAERSLVGQRETRTRGLTKRAH